jgi:16S rRNA processing protein RimM
LEKGLEKLLSVGKILNFHGIKGEVKVGFSKGDEEILSEIKQFLVVKEDKSLFLNVEELSFHKNNAIVKFKEINSVEEALALKGVLLKVDKQKLNRFLKEDEFYINDLIGLNAYDELGKFLGKITGVVNLKEQDVLFIEDLEKREHMVPFTKEIVPEVNLKEERLIINKIEGLLEK